MTSPLQPVFLRFRWKPTANTDIYFRRLPDIRREGATYGQNNHKVTSKLLLLNSGLAVCCTAVIKCPDFIWHFAEQDAFNKAYAVPKMGEDYPKPYDQPVNRTFME